MLQIRPGLVRAWRGPGRLQLGLEPGHGVILDGLTSADERLLAALDAGSDASGLTERLGVDPARAGELVAALRDAGALLPSRTVRSRLARLPDALRQRLHPDAAVLSVAYPDGDGWHVLAERRTACVVVTDAGRTGLAVALGLAAAGVGCVLAEDAGRVRPGDRSPSGYTPSDVGRRRGEAAADLLGRLAPHTRTSVRGRVRPDLAVLVGHGALDPRRAEGLHREDVAHLAVVVGETGAVVGPLVVPGRSTCLRCVHLHRCDRDPEWPRVAAQLAAPRGADAQPAEESSLAALAAALATSQALAHLDGRSSPITRDATVETTLVGGHVAVRPWPPHPACGCRWEP